MTPLSVYIHWPFCVSKCPYCDFNSRVLPSALEEGAWQEAYINELSHYAARLPDREIATIYFGGGTPSLMQPQTVATLLDKMVALWRVQQNCEITLEANPSSSEIGKFQAFKSAGVNRLSLGVQALNDASLRFLGRAHDAQEAREAIKAAAKTFDRFSFDLIYGRVGQTPAAWEAELGEALTFGSKHMSLYQLTIEEGTSFHKRAANETLTAPDDASAQMYEATQEIMAMAGLPAYEISNHAAAGQESRHNLTYWHYGDYIGIGAGAHGRFVEGNQRYATENHRNPDAWRQQVVAGGHGRAKETILDQETAMREALMMGLRLVTGIDKAAWHRKFALPLKDYVPQHKVSRLVHEGLLVKDAATLRASPKGLETLNAVLAFLLS